MSADHCCGAETSAELSQEPLYRRILWTALLVNAAMFAVEIFASRVSQSMSLQADALDFFADAANYAITLFVLPLATVWRSRAGLFKGLSMLVFGIFVLASALIRVLAGEVPEATTMGAVAVLALIANVGVAILLYRYRGGDSNMQSIWLCSRNDAIGNLAVMLAAIGVYGTASRWPDLVVAVLIASLSISAAYRVILMAREEMREPSTN